MPDLPIPEAGYDILTPAVAAISRDAGSSAYTRLVVGGNAPTKGRSLQGIKPGELFSKPVKHADGAAAALAGLWLWHDALDECHKIVQDIASPTGSMWHAIMHRREGDFSNSKYWYDRCAVHPVNKWIGSVASSVVGDKATELGRLLDGWSPRAFVDLVESVHNTTSDPRHETAVRLQRVEWEALFDYSVRQAIETDGNRLDDWDRRAGKMGAGM